MAPFLKKDIENKIAEKLRYFGEPAICKINGNKYSIAYCHSMNDTNYFDISINISDTTITVNIEQ